jgi:hypothetical protein
MLDNGSGAAAAQAISHDQQTNYQHSNKEAKIDHPGMMGDGTEEQNLNEPGDPSVRIESDEVDAAFGKKEPKKP